VRVSGIPHEERFAGCDRFVEPGQGRVSGEVPGQDDSRIVVSCPEVAGVLRVVGKVGDEVLAERDRPEQVGFPRARAAEAELGHPCLKNGRHQSRTQVDVLARTGGQFFEQGDAPIVECVGLAGLARFQERPAEIDLRDGELAAVVDRGVVVDQAARGLDHLTGLGHRFRVT
jgi:hypothetical protein